MNKCVIVGAGDCNGKFLQQNLKINKGDLCIAADGGFDYLLEIGIMPDIIVGDFDSCTTENILQDIEKTGNVFIKRLPIEKDDTDMLSAIKEGLMKEYKYFEIYGAIGGRLDHTFANIQCLLYLLNHGAKGVIVGMDMRIMLIRNESMIFKAIDYKADKRISVFAYGQNAVGVTEKGLKYLLDNVILKQDYPIGVSNQFIGEDAEVSVTEGMLLICIEN